MINFIVIKAKDKFYISDNIEDKSYFSSTIPYSKINGEIPKATYKEFWFEINDLPHIVEVKCSDTYINKGFKLKNGYSPTEILPEFLEKLEDDDERYGLYSPLTEKIEGSYKTTPFTYDLIEEDKPFMGQPKFCYSTDILDQIQNHSALWSSKKATLSGEEFYKIIRKYVKENIDNRYAKITSDYDFCFEVCKILKIEPKPYKTKVQISKRKTVERIDYKKNRQVVVFSSSPGQYSTYPIQSRISAPSYLELEEKVNAYLENLIKLINEPLKECVTCKGTGVVLDFENHKIS